MCFIALSCIAGIWSHIEPLVCPWQCLMYNRAVLSPISLLDPTCSCRVTTNFSVTPTCTCHARTDMTWNLHVLWTHGNDEDHIPLLSPSPQDLSTFAGVRQAVACRGAGTGTGRAVAPCIHLASIVVQASNRQMCTERQLWWHLHRGVCVEYPPESKRWLRTSTSLCAPLPPGNVWLLVTDRTVAALRKLGKIEVSLGIL